MQCQLCGFISGLQLDHIHARTPIQCLERHILISGKDMLNLLMNDTTQWIDHSHVKVQIPRAVDLKLNQ